VALASEHAPGDTGQLVGQRHRQDIAVQASGRRLEPRAKAVLGPVFRSQQNDPGAPNEERAQVGIAALGDAPEDSINGGFACTSFGP